jgi:hypothetical protein
LTQAHVVVCARPEGGLHEQGLRHGKCPAFHLAIAIELIDVTLPFPARWEASNISRAKVIDAAPYRPNQFNWEAVPARGDMEHAMFRTR